MAKLRPIKRKDLISSLRQLDFTGPYAGGKHEYCSVVDSKYVSLILIRVILASHWHCSNAFLMKQMFPCRNGNNYKVSLTRPTRQAFRLKTFTPNNAPFPLLSVS
jgi:hypothetical protein